MRNAFTILTAGALISGAVFAQDTSESVDSVLNELSKHKGAPAPMATPEMVAPSMVAPAMVEAADLDIEATLSESRDLYIGGEFEQAQKGFEAVVKRDPENITATTYLRKIMERDQRSVEVKGMNKVDASWCTAMVQRSYALADDAVEKMGLEGIETATDVVRNFPEVKFPEGATAVYQPKLEKIFVRNTRSNLEVLEEILDAMDVTKHNTEIDQVEIEAKFVEVSEGTLEELGFEWDFDGIVSTGIEGGDVIASDGTGLFAKGLRGGSQSPALPFSQPNSLASGNGVTGATGDWSSYDLENTFSSNPAELKLRSEGSNPLEMLITALDQSSGTDVLSAPRIVTRSGEEATIRVGQIHYYPEVYETGAGEGTIVHVSYQDFEEKLLGVELVVTPEINGEQIEMALNPRITELNGYQNYTIAPANSSYTYYRHELGFVFNHDEIVASLPVFKKREIETEVTIANGSTLAMGGLISENVESYEDKVPVLGSLPLVGRLFRNEGERAVKRNLMMFVTAKTVDPSGRINTARSFE